MNDKQPDSAPRSSGSNHQGRLALASPLASCLVCPKPHSEHIPPADASPRQSYCPPRPQSCLPCSFPPPDRGPPPPLPPPPPSGPLEPTSSLRPCNPPIFQLPSRFRLERSLPGQSQNGSKGAGPVLYVVRGSAILELGSRVSKRGSMAGREFVLSRR